MVPLMSSWTDLKRILLAEEHIFNIIGTEGIHSCGSIRSSGQKSAAFPFITTDDMQMIICRSLPADKAPGCE